MLKNKKSDVGYKGYFILCIIIIVILGALVCLLVKNRTDLKNENAELKKTETTSMTENSSKVDENIVREITTVNTSNMDTNEMITTLFSNQMKDNYGADDVSVTSIKVLTKEEASKISDSYAQAADTDIFADITYDVKVSNHDNTLYTDGVGTIDGDWVRGKSMFGRFVKDENGNYYLEYSTVKIQ